MAAKGKYKAWRPNKGSEVGLKRKCWICVYDLFCDLHHYLAGYPYFVLTFGSHSKNFLAKEVTQLVFEAL